ncbi:MAG: DUF6320 domain-containing protein [Oscillospiraceae bacterium]|nr:DUF6320 domain-containing protein [Oscillospiraceae bacterium]
MKFCEKCNVSVLGETKKCPLCQNSLPENGETAEPDIFPFVPLARQKHSLLFRLLQLGSATLIIVSAVFNLIFPQRGPWSLFVAAGALCVWISLIFAIRKKNNILKNLAYQVTIASIFSVLWDVFTGWHGWSVDFFVPIAFVSAMSATAIISRILKVPPGTFIAYSCLLMLYGIIPAVFIISGLNSVILPSLICVACSLFSFAALLIFEGRNMAAELRRRLHL